MRWNNGLFGALFLKFSRFDESTFCQFLLNVFENQRRKQFVCSLIVRLSCDVHADVSPNWSFQFWTSAL